MMKGGSIAGGASTPNSNTSSMTKKKKKRGTLSVISITSQKGSDDGDANSQIIKEGDVVRPSGSLEEADEMGEFVSATVEDAEII